MHILYALLNGTFSVHESAQLLTCLSYIGDAFRISKKKNCSSALVVHVDHLCFSEALVFPGIFSAIYNT